MKYKYSRKEFLKKVGFLFSKGKILVPNEVDGEELMKLLLAQKEERKECCGGHCNGKSTYVENMAKIYGVKVKHPTPSQLEDFVQKKDKKECKHQYLLKQNHCYCVVCGKSTKPTPSPLKIEEIEEMYVPPQYLKNFTAHEQIVVEKINELISNQKKLYQLIKEKL